MKIITNANVDPKTYKDFFGEFQAIRLRFKKIIKKPNMKLKSVFRSFSRAIVCYIVLNILSVILYQLSLEPAWLFTIGVVTFATILYIVLLLAMEKSYREFLKLADSSVIEIDETGISLEKGDQFFEMKWEAITHILINQYSIACLPDAPSKIMLAFDLEKKDEIIKGIIEYGHQDLIVDNTNLYR